MIEQDDAIHSSLSDSLKGFEYSQILACCQSEIMILLGCDFSVCTSKQMYSWGGSGFMFNFKQKDDEFFDLFLESAKFFHAGALILDEVIQD